MGCSNWIYGVDCMIEAPVGFVKAIDQNGEPVFMRKPVSVVYPCGKCGRPRYEKYNKSTGGVEILKCLWSSCTTPKEP